MKIVIARQITTVHKNVPLWRLVRKGTGEIYYAREHKDRLVNLARFFGSEVRFE